MQKLGQYISDLRGLIEQYSRTSEPYTDQFLYRLLSVSRGKILKQRLDKFVNISNDNWLRVCFQLEVVNSYNCNCVPDYLECKVLRTKYKVPQVLSGRNKSKIKVSLLDGTSINVVSESEWIRAKDNEFKSKLPHASQVNGYIYIWNLPLNLKVVQIEGLWADVTSLSSIQCNDGFGDVPCFDMTTTDFPIDEELTGVIYEECLRLLNVPMQNIQDKTNDNNQDIR